MILQNQESSKSFSPYTLMPFAFEPLPDGGFFLSGLAGDFTFLSNDDFNALVSDKLSPDSLAFIELESKKLITVGNSAARMMTASGLLSRKAFTFSGPRLHIVVITRGCNCHCDYCHASSYPPGENAPYMTIEMAAATAKTIMSSPSREITVEFQGGEPTLAWETIRFLVDYIRLLNVKARKSICFVLCTNLLSLNQEMLDFITTRGIEVSTSLDGPADLHDLHRRMPNGSAHDLFLKNLKLLESKTGKKSSSLLTVTHSNLHELRKVIDHYIECDRNGIFIRSLNLFGRGALDKNLAYSTEEFTESFIDALEYILEINRGGKKFREFIVSLFLKRIYTSFDDGFVDLKFPAGAGMSVLVYDFNGDVYPSDEARMMAAVGDTRLRMGNVQFTSGEAIRNSPIAKQILVSSIPSLIPGCTSCPYAPYCGVDPIKAYSETGDFFQLSETGECRKNRAILRWLFYKLRNADVQLKHIFQEWTA
jgi:His-Xaa-Ser system radical SAM maturase HxsB